MQSDVTQSGSQSAAALETFFLREEADFNDLRSCTISAN